MMPEPKLGDIRIVKSWWPEQAKYHYSLQVYRWINSITKTEVWYDICFGDLEWARKTAEHYGLEIINSTTDSLEERRNSLLKQYKGVI